MSKKKILGASPSETAQSAASPQPSASGLSAPIAGAAKPMIYEVINPSDMVTFLAHDHKCALMAVTLVGNGNYGLDCKDDRQADIPALQLFNPDGVSEIVAYLDASLTDFLDANTGAVAAALKSFSYLSAEERRTYDDAVAAITDPGNLKRFKAEHEDRNRTSMNRIVQRAWDMAEKVEQRVSGRNGTEGEPESVRP